MRKWYGYWYVLATHTSSVNTHLLTPLDTASVMSLESSVFLGLSTSYTLLQVTQTDVTPACEPDGELLWLHGSFLLSHSHLEARSAASNGTGDGFPLSLSFDAKTAEGSGKRTGCESPATSLHWETGDNSHSLNLRYTTALFSWSPASSFLTKLVSHTFSFPKGEVSWLMSLNLTTEHCFHQLSSASVCCCLPECILTSTQNKPFYSHFSSLTT